MNHFWLSTAMIACLVQTLDLVLTCHSVIPSLRCQNSENGWQEIKNLELDILFVVGDGLKTVEQLCLEDSSQEQFLAINWLHLEELK